MLAAPLLRQGADHSTNCFNFVEFVEFAAITLALPLVLATAIGARRVRGVAPFVFAGLLVFAVAPLLGLRVTQALGGMQWSAPWVLAGGIDIGAVVLALPVGLVAWWRLKTLARGYDAKRFSDAQLLAHSWWLMYVAVYAVDHVNTHADSARVVQIVAIAAVAYALFPFLLSRALMLGRSAVCPRCRAGCCSCCASSATARALVRCSSRSHRAGSASAR